MQCREKWSNSLDPSVNADAYSAEEDNRLIAVTYALQHQLQQWQQQREHQEGQTAASSLTGAAPSSSGATTAASSSSSSSSNPSSSSSSTANPATTGTIHTPATSSTSPPPPVAAAEGAHRVMRYGVNEELMRGIDTSSVRWARVAEYLPGRTDASVRSRYNQILKGKNHNLQYRIYFYPANIASRIQDTWL